MAGALITTASAVVFIALVIAELIGLFENPYAGLVVFLAIPAVFLGGLLLIPLGMWLQQRKLERHPEAAAGWPVIDFGQARRTPTRAPLYRAHSGERHHPSHRWIRQPPLDGLAAILRTGLS